MVSTEYDLFNLISLIIYPCGQLELQVCQNIESLLPNTKPPLDQALLSLTMPRKTGSSDVIGTSHKQNFLHRNVTY